MSKQRAFDISLNHIRQQGRPSIMARPNPTVGGPACMYKSPEGLGCAFAPFIKKYDVKLERRAAHQLMRDYDKHVYAWVLKVNESFMSALQVAHDSASDMADFMQAYEANMERLAAQHNLEYTPL